MKPPGTILGNLICNSLLPQSGATLTAILSHHLTFGVCAFHSTFQERNWGVSDKRKSVFETLLHGRILTLSCDKKHQKCFTP